MVCALSLFAVPVVEDQVVEGMPEDENDVQGVFHRHVMSRCRHGEAMEAYFFFRTTLIGCSPRTTVTPARARARARGSKKSLES